MGTMGYTYHGYTYHDYTYHGYTYHGYTYYRRAMGTMGFSEELQLQMLGVISICLQLGNISFSGGEAGRHRGNEACTVVGGDWAQWSAHLLGVEEQKLAKALTYRTITETGGGKMQVLMRLTLTLSPNPNPRHNPSPSPNLNPNLNPITLTLLLTHNPCRT